MAPFNIQPFTKVLFLFVLFALLLIPPSSSLKPSIQLVGRRNLLEKNQAQEYSDGIQQSSKKKQGTTTIALGTTTQSKNKTKLIKPTSTSTSNSTKTQTNLKKLNSTSKPLNLTKPTSKTQTLSSKSTNSTKPTSKTQSLSSKSTNSTKTTSKTQSLSSKSTNLTKPTSKSSNNTKPISKTTNPTKPTSTLTQKPKDPTKKTKPSTISKKSTQGLTFAQYKEKQQEEDDDDFMSEFKDLPSRFQETLIPDLEVISTTSKSYLNNANKHITKQVKPLVGKKYAPMVASITSFVFILIPFLLVSLIFNKIKAYFSLQKLIIFIQIYLSIYFSILSLSTLVTGLEPLKFFYNTSQSTYVCIQLLQTLCYVLYLVLVLMYFVLVFSTDNSVGSRLLGFGQMFVGLAVGLHYYMTVFHRAVLRQPPKTSWKVHSVYATCFLLICLLATAERRKKAYVVDGFEEEKKN